MEQTLITQNRIDLGIDMWPVYQSSQHYPHLPNFVEIYENYKVEMIKLETDMTQAEIRRHLLMIEQGVYNMQPSDSKFETRPLADVYAYMLQEKYSFRSDKLFNLPMTEVW